MLLKTRSLVFNPLALSRTFLSTCFLCPVIRRLDVPTSTHLSGLAFTKEPSLSSKQLFTKFVAL